MPSKHKTSLIGWHPADPELKPWLEAEATRRGVPVSRLLDEALATYRTRTEAPTTRKASVVVAGEATV